MKFNNNIVNGICQDCGVKGLEPALHMCSDSVLHHKNIGFAIEQCAGSLPEGWVLGIAIENGSAWIELFDHNNDKVALPDSSDQSLTEQVLDALNLAIDRTT